METVEVRRARPADDPALLTLKATKVPAMRASDVPRAPYCVVDGDTGNTTMLVLQAPREHARAAVDALREYGGRYNMVLRSAGVRTTSQTFGYGAPSPVLQRNVPTATSWAIDHPTGHAALDRFAGWAWDQLQEHGPPEVVALMRDLRDRVHTDWRMGDSPWTSGIANDTVPLYYHYDRNNVRHAWSTMLAARAGMRGGDLHVADYDLIVPIRDRDVVFFPGVDLMHGVTPMSKTLRGGFRYTFVWYPVRKFDGMPGAVEARAAAQVRRTEVEADTLARQRRSGMMRPEVTP